MPEISVLMGIYNESKENAVLAVDSILNQTLNDFEFIICDDGSESSFFQWLQEFCNKDARIRLLRRETNKGLASALNYCLRYASGTYIARMDGDDISRKDRLEKQAAFLQEHKEYDFVGCNAELFSDNCIWGVRRMEEIPQRKSFLSTSPFIHPSVMIRRKVLEQAGGYCESSKVMRVEDYELFIRLYAAGCRGYNLQENLLQYRESMQTYRRRKYRYRVKECWVRWQGFGRLGILNGNMRYVVKPLVVGLIPDKAAQKIRQKKYGGGRELIGIVILNYRNWEDTRRCVESIWENPPGDAYRIILVDNASECLPRFDLVSFLVQYKIVFIQNNKNLGYNAGNNIGIAKAQEIGCDDILLSNNDIRYFPNSIQVMQDYLHSHPTVGIVGPKILDLNGQVQKSCLCRKTGLKEKYIVRTRANVIFRKSRRTYFGLDRNYEQTFCVYAVLGCCFMISKICAQAVTPLDEYPFLYEEELMLGIRMQEQGFATVYYPKAVVEHLHGKSTQQVKAFAFAQNVRSEIYYCRKYLHAGKWQIYPLYWYRVLLYLARCYWQKDFRRNFRWFLKMTSEEFRQF